MDLIDLFIGSEGVLGIITEVDLILLEEPNIRSGIMLFMDTNISLVDFVEWVRKDKNIITAIEYFDKNSLNLLTQFRDVNPSIKRLPKIDSNYEGAIYLEFHANNEIELNELLGRLSSNLVNFGVNETEQWLGIEPSDYDKLKLLRHAVPECVNILIANHKQINIGIHKVGTDMSVPADKLIETLKMYRKDLAEYKFNNIIFGHIGDSHLHVNIIPGNIEQYLEAKQLIKNWAKVVASYQGSVTAEHGVGKLKKELLKVMVHKTDLENMKKIKTILDPKNMFNQGTMLD